MTSTTIAPKKAAVPGQTRSALSGTARPARPSAVGATLTHSWRALMKIKHNFMGTLVETTITPIMVLLIFTFLFGGAIAGSIADYRQLFVPGVMVQSVVLMTVYTGMFLSTDINKGVFNRFRTMPFWQPASILGNLVADVIRYLVAMLSVLGVGLIMGFRPQGGFTGVVLAMLVLAMFAFAVSWIFSMLGIMSKAPETVNSTTMIVMYPLMFTSNIFVPTESLPGFMQAVVKVNPITHAVTAVRGFMHDTITAGQIWSVVAISIAIVLVFAPLTFALYGRKGKV